jgi:hypothetical protein
MPFISPFNFTLSIETDPELFTFESFAPGITTEFLIKDSIFEYFPKMELSIIDDDSLFTETYYFTENINVNIELQDQEENKIKHNFYLSTCNLDENLSELYISGKLNMYLFSDFYKQDIVKSKSYNMNISDVVRKIMSSYNYPNLIPSIKLSPTSNFDTWYQVQQFDYQFINKIRKYALNINNKNSPYYTFIDMNGSFNFKTVIDLLDQEPIAYYYFGILSEQDSKSYKRIMDYSFSMLGSGYNYLNYNSKIYNVNKSGNYNKKEIKLDEKIKDNKIALNKLSIRKESLDHTTSYRYYGIVDNPLQENHYKGWINNEFINSISFPYRMFISLMFDATLASGKVIQLYFNSIIKEKDNKATEYSGNWLILECTHTIQGSDNVMMTNLLLGKSSVKIYSDHKFYNEFI